jgi:lipopolysaccharide transport system ATP-binding protein
MSALRPRRTGSTQDRDLWALRDVSFDVNHGEVLGVIGRNGAGKSTLLKVLSRITEPSTGYADVYGRVGSLLEVGTGFHPELTGRENIYLNGQILGMSKADIRRRFDEIVAFAELERFLDTPVKRYSSGMYMRLAFSVAAHLEPEVLVVDEVLAVGDVRFQTKCLSKMGEVAGHGRTVLLVSHNMAAITGLCRTALLLDQGRVAACGETEGVVRQYITDVQSGSSGEIGVRGDRRGIGEVRFTRVHYEDDSGGTIEYATAGQPLVIALDYTSTLQQPLNNCLVSIVITDSLGRVLFNCASSVSNPDPVTLEPHGTVRCLIPWLPLSQSRYFVSPFLRVNQEIQDWVDGAATLDVVDADIFGTGRLYPEGWEGTGVIVPHRWLTENSTTQN